MFNPIKVMINKIMHGYGNKLMENKQIISISNHKL